MYPQHAGCPSHCHALRWVLGRCGPEKVSLSPLFSRPFDDGISWKMLDPFADLQPLCYGINSTFAGFKQTIVVHDTIIQNSIPFGDRKNHYTIHHTYTIWLVVWLPFFIFPYIGNNNPNWRTIFFRGVQTANQILTPYFCRVGTSTTPSGSRSDVGRRLFRHPQQLDAAWQPSSRQW